MLKRKTKIKYRVMRLGIISVIVSSVVLTIASTIITQAIQVAKFDEELESLSDAYVTNISSLTNTIKMQIESTAAYPKLVDTSLSDAEIKKILEELATTTYFHDFSIANPDGTTMNNTNISEREYFQRALNGETFISSPVVRLTDSSITTMVGTKMPDGRVLYGALESELFSNGLKSKTDDSRLVLVLDKDGMVIASSDPSLVEEQKNYYADKDEVYGDLSEKMINGENGNYKLSRDGESCGSYFQTIDKSNGWSICVIGSYSDALNGVYKAILISAGMSILLIVIEIIVAFKVAGRITGSVSYSAERLNLLSYGDIHSDAEVKYTNDETEDMTSSLSLAVSKLRQYINTITENLQGMANGDFSISNDMEFNGDFVKISDAFSEINDTLGKLITEINIAASDVLKGVRQISNDSAALADGSTKQSTAVEELNTTMSKVAEQAENAAKNAEYAAHLTATSAEKVNQQEEEMQNMLSAITEVKEKSNEISSIIKTIEDISFQTNILALNASIEAARAGDAGRGFAVVADEVVDLANKSSQAAQDSADLISQTLSAVNRGFKAANESAAKMTEVRKMSEKVSELVTDIAQTSTDQATAISQTTAGIEQISEVVAQNSVTAIHTASSCEQLTVQANSLRDKISVLKV
ncbi:methyl-accepting chemotaxis protein [Ruminococcus sp. NK3A76]|uniref:methyl-accepting chemotaxis protein n=1 Tax=Ruminococcus sp. NK3A76 TaxID=877411 RepID=UPI00048BA443|nr:methyl-accepting chemotaxis protein [Ruminococcus sp. NK3A76]